jgi:hypothetical protein
MSIRDQIRALAQKAQETVSSGTGGMTIRLANKMFTLPDGTSEKGPMECVVLGYMSRNTKYKEQYQQGQFNPPTCFAQGPSPKALAPDPAKVPHPEAKTCSECPHDQWGSGGAKRKACKNTRLLAVVPPNADPNAPLLMVQVSPKAIKSWDNYVVTLGAKDKIPLSVVTQMDFDPSAAYPLLTFKELTDNANEELHFSRMREAEALLSQAPMLAGDEEGSGNGSGGGKPPAIAAPPVRRGKKV